MDAPRLISELKFEFLTTWVRLNFKRTSAEDDGQGQGQNVPHTLALVSLRDEQTAGWGWSNNTATGNGWSRGRGWSKCTATGSGWSRGSGSNM